MFVVLVSVIVGDKYDLKHVLILIFELLMDNTAHELAPVNRNQSYA